MEVWGHSFLLMGLLAFLGMQLHLAMAECPLDLSRSNFTLVASMCSNKDDRGKCCRYINAYVAVSIARYANATSNLGVTSNLSDICLHSISQTMDLHGVSRNATVFCGFGTKIPVSYDCRGRTTVMQMLQSPKFMDVTENCKLPLSKESDCRKCLNAGIVYLHHLVGVEDNMTLSTCRDATFAVLASQLDYGSAVDLASCFFQVQGLDIPSESSPSSLAPEASPSPLIAASPSQLTLGVPQNGQNGNHHSYHLTLIPTIGIAVTAGAVMMLIVLIVLIRRKSRELEYSENTDKISMKSFPPPRSMRKFQEGSSSMFRKFGYKETKKATDNFNTVIGQGGFGTVYKAQFSDGSLLAVKRMNKVSEQGEDEFCRELELLARLHHRHLVALRGFCIKKCERLLMYEYMANGSLKDHLHCMCFSNLHSSVNCFCLAFEINFYKFNHRSVIFQVLDADVIELAKPACAMSSPSLAWCPRRIALLGRPNMSSAAQAAPGRAPLSWQTRIQIAIDVANALEYLHFYCDPPLCHRDIKSSNILLDENFVAKIADFGLVHASKDGSVCFEPVNTDIRGTPESRLSELVDPRIKDSFDLEQLQTVVRIVRWCTQREGQTRPSIKQVLRILYESSDPMHSGFVQAVEDEEYEETDGRPRTSKGKMHRSDPIFHSGDGRYLASSSSTSRSYCSRSFLLETGSPQSPPNLLSL
ncbi:hypothetical protein Patl1_35537 [Pistacia atlantica]|nr:hypothetical protein Patl1_35537 [Pistacia atlantica]